MFNCETVVASAKLNNFRIDMNAAHRRARTGDVRVCVAGVTVRKPYTYGMMIIIIVSYLLFIARAYTFHL